MIVRFVVLIARVSSAIKLMDVEENKRTVTKVIKLPTRYIIITSLKIIIT